jgi:hypothetical protein
VYDTGARYSISWRAMKVFVPEPGPVASTLVPGRPSSGEAPSSCPSAACGAGTDPDCRPASWLSACSRADPVSSRPGTESQNAAMRASSRRVNMRALLTCR